MIVTANREEFIRKNFFELSFNDKSDYFEKFKTLTSTELHFLVEIYNWDDSVEILSWIINSNKCNKGTALMIFWKSAPDYYFGRQENELEIYEMEVYQLLNVIIESFKSNKFKSTMIKYDPADDFDLDSKEILYWNLPNEMLHQTKGFKPIYLGTIVKSLKNHYKKFIKSKRR